VIDLFNWKGVTHTENRRALKEERIRVRMQTRREG